MIRYVIISTLIHVFLIIVIFGFPRLFVFEKHRGDTNITSIRVSLNNYEFKSVDSRKKEFFSDNLQSVRVQESEVRFDEEKEGLLSGVESVSSSDEEYTIDNQTSALVPPKVIYTPKIEYPLYAKLRGIQGSVVLSITISTNGRVVGSRIVSGSGSELLDTSAERFVRGVLFEPARDDRGNPIIIETTYIVHFVLK
ncbi:MAG: energy transducer TonB [Spirochaetia bacterium]|nr:energy transducer TonB [Spirochaetota bacterium]MDW8113060.1 energy transducer TonB [Spirochaetia bacterium]